MLNERRDCVSAKFHRGPVPQFLFNKSEVLISRLSDKMRDEERRPAERRIWLKTL